MPFEMALRAGCRPKYSGAITLMLKADDVGVGEVQEVGRPPIAFQVLFGDLESDLWRVIVPLEAVVHRDNEALGRREAGGSR